MLFSAFHTHFRFLLFSSESHDLPQLGTVDVLIFYSVKVRVWTPVKVLY